MFPLRALLRPAALRVPYHPPSPARPLAGASPSALLRSRTRIPPLPTIGNSHATQHRFFSQSPRWARPPPPTGGYDPRDPAHREVLNEYRLRTAQPLVTEAGLWRLAKSRGTHTIIVIAFLSAIGFYYYNLQTVPVSGRQRFNCYSEAWVDRVSDEQVKRVIYEVESQGGRFLPSWDPRSQMVARVMRRLIPVSGLDGQEWEVRVIDDPHTLNAFVLPGGKVFVHSGILRVTRNEDGLAAVLGHEIAHNLAQHVGERMSSSIGPNILLGSLVLLSGMFPPAIILVQYLGSGLMDLVFTRPMGRLQESEADYIGLMLMAEACYDPREAVAFWQRMDMAAKRGHAEEVPELLSTHPSNEHRIEKYKEWMPKAIEKWEASECKGTASFANMFRRALDRGSMIVEF
ncbi:mitochondrial metalloendopeptidase OMA1 [Colletotrichum tofieldiae]|uniref:Mitochondrial metalloendopeptidase OMA1 n=1 Tax=Colletotrichum tofieldiae TaxID=708197 RepID=A0A166WZP3_9PEZI|nr:mitochondrial metalloendopeptidase OMA1 [Colletotrichum tofieldiae]GKT60339.1 mitochondrial metalloendopeptidase OMA1 [Colletotrichum tofieldiae]GKT68049.1 mitochondrial metalloendopeptidase OMA1 [Colletotrichum tofieldiae]